MKFSWHPTITDLVVWNSDQTEEINLNKFEDLLIAGIKEAEFEQVADEMVVDYS